MRNAIRFSIPAIVLIVLVASSAQAIDWSDQKSEWHGSDRYDFQVDGRNCYVVVPSNPAPGNPWIWRARFPGYHPEADLILLQRGFHIAHMDTNGMLGSPKAMEHWDAFYEYMTAQGLAERPALEGVSRGGLFVYGWAARHPDRVACIYADTPVCDFRSWPLGQGDGIGHEGTWQTLLAQYDFTHDEALAYEKCPIDILEPIAAAHVPMLTVVSLTDEVVPPTENTFILAERYRQLDGSIDIIEVEEGTDQSHGHHFTHPDPLRVADFIERYASAAPRAEDYLFTRDGLNNCRVRFEQEHTGRVAFLGGSITHMSGWRNATMAYLRERFPETEFDFISAGNPSMGSTPGAYRLARDVLSRGEVDLLFVEAGVNDSTNGRSPTAMTRGMEGIVRHVRSESPLADVVIMHFVDPQKMATYRGGDVPVVVEQHEAVAEHYGVPSIHLAREVTERIDAGQFTWAEDFRNLHPSPYGQRLYAASIRRLFASAWDKPLADNATAQEQAFPGDPLDSFNYDGGQLVAIATAESLKGFEIIENCDPRASGVGGGTRPGFVNVPMLVGTEPGSEFQVPFTGRAVGLFVAAGRDAGTIEFRIDEGDWQTQDLFTHWSGSLHLPWAYVLAAELDGGQHTLTVRIADEKNEASTGHACRIAHILVNQ